MGEIEVGYEKIYRINRLFIIIKNKKVEDIGRLGCIPCSPDCKESLNRLKRLNYFLKKRGYNEYI